MMNEAFERIARAAVIENDLKEAGVEMHPHQKRATIELNLRLQPKIRKAIGGIEFTHENSEEIRALAYQATLETFAECADYFRELGDWDAFGEIHWMRGRT